MQVAHKYFKGIVLSSYFDNFLMLCVLANTVVLAMEGLFNDDASLDRLKNLNLFFTIMFTIELALKIIALGIISKHFKGLIILFI